MTAPIASGGSESPGGPCTHWKTPPFHGARRYQPLPCAQRRKAASSFKCGPRLRCADGWSVHGQNYAKARLPSHHLRIGIRRLIERDRLNHGGHAAQRTEAERFVAGRGVPRQGTFELAAPEYEIHARDLDRLWPDAEDDRDTAGRQPLECFGDR